MANFSSDASGKPPVRFSPRVGNVGARAAERALKPSRGQNQPQASPTQGSRQSPRLGHPGASQGMQQGQAQGQAQPDQPSDNRHLDLVGGWSNIKALGRDVPFTVWAGLTGNYRQLAKPGQPPFDVFED